MLPACQQVVAAIDGQLVSVYDGETTYRLGKWTYAKHGAASWPPLYACFYGHLTAQQVCVRASGVCLKLSRRKTASCGLWHERQRVLVGTWGLRMHACCRLVHSAFVGAFWEGVPHPMCGSDAPHCICRRSVRSSPSTAGCSMRPR